MKGLWANISIIRLSSSSLSAGGTHQQRGEPGWSPSGGILAVKLVHSHLLLRVIPSTGQWLGRVMSGGNTHYQIRFIASSGGGNHQWRGKPGWSLSGENPNSGVCHTAHRLADKVPVGGFTLLSLKGCRTHQWSVRTKWIFECVKSQQQSVPNCP